MSSSVAYSRIPVWVRDYAAGGIPDQRAVGDFMECETSVTVRALQGELMAVASGKYIDDHFDKIVGIKRRENHGSYSEWARQMLLWIASYKR